MVVVGLLERGGDYGGWEGETWGRKTSFMNVTIIDRVQKEGRSKVLKSMH